MDSRRLDLNLLVTLETLLVELNVTRAAQRLHLSQPAVSAQLARLRRLYGDRLLIASRRGMTPTQKALELLPELRRALDQVREAVQTQQVFDPAQSELVATIACTDYVQAAVLLPLVGELRERAPKFRLAIRNLDVRALESQMDAGDVDLAFMTPQEAPPKLRTRHLFDEQYELVARHRHPALKSNLTAAALVKLKHVVVSLRGGEFRTPLDVVLSEMGLDRDVVLSAASFQFVVDIVARTDLVAFVPRRLVRARSGDLQVLPCPIPTSGFAVGLVWHERSHAHPGQRWLREQFVSLLAQRPSAAAPSPGIHLPASANEEGRPLDCGCSDAE